MKSIRGKTILGELNGQMKLLALVTLTSERIGFKYIIGSWNDVIGEWTGSGLISKKIILLLGCIAKGESIEEDTRFWWSQVIENSTTKNLFSPIKLDLPYNDFDENKHF